MLDLARAVATWTSLSHTGECGHGFGLVKTFTKIIDHANRSGYSFIMPKTGKPLARKGLGERLQRTRELLGLTQVRFAELSGLARSEIAMAEIGRNGVSTSRFRDLLAKGFGVDVSALVELVEGTMTPEELVAMSRRRANKHFVPRRIKRS